jgi:zinc transporter 5/7
MGVISGLVLVWNYEQLHLSMIMVTLACSMVIQITTIENSTTVNYKQGSPTIVGFISVLLEILSFKTNFMENRFRAVCEVLLIFLSAFIPVDDTLFEELDKVEIHEQSIIRQLFQHEDTKAIFSYLMLNTLFMFVQFLYSFRSKSLGLLSDSLHMALDCTSLALGLVAGVLAKRPPNNSFPFGLSRIETLAGFANGVLLIGIVAGIVIEAIERIINPITLERTGELLVVSFLGFVVNIIGIFAFNHGHDHGHSHGHSHSHGSEGEHDNENMKGIFLHILADTLGSAGVVVSTILASVFHTSIFDPIASLFIAVMIFISAIPLVKSSASNLLLSLGDKKEELMRDILSQISTTPGVVGYTTPRFFVSSDIKTLTITTSGVSKSVDIGTHGHEHSHEVLHEHLHGHPQEHLHSHDHKRTDEPHSHDDNCNDKYTLVGYIHIQYLDGENSTIIKKRVQKIFENSNIHATIQVESESSTCWCRKSQ